MLLVVVILQNRIQRKTLAKLAAYLFVGGLIIISTVTAFRLMNESKRDLSQYIETEFFQRLDGLEVASKLVGIHGYQPFGINTSAAIYPIISQFPFSQKAVELKAEGLTTVKASILSNELGEVTRDVNSFVVLDAYYLGGLLGVGCTGFLVGLLSRLIDRSIALSKSWVMFVGMVAIAINLIILEREILGMATSIVRDFVILTFAYIMVFLNIQILPPSSNRTIRPEPETP
jgi:hypothetical protein